MTFGRGEGQVVGRGAELAAADRFLDGLAVGPAALVIGGDAGIGKTTILRAVMDAASQRGFRTLTSRPAHAEADLSFVVLADLLAAVADEVAEFLPEPQRRALDAALLRGAAVTDAVDVRALGTAVLTCLDRLAASGPLVMGIDDLHWLDPASHRALDFALRRLDDQRVGVVGATRLDLSAHRIPVIREGEERITVEPMSLAGLHRLVDERLGVTLARPSLIRLERASGGNPLLALEIMRTLSRDGGDIDVGESVPAPIEVVRLVAARISALSAETNDLLRVVAAFARPDMAVLQSATGSRDVRAALMPAVDAGLIAVNDEGVRFSHPLYASAVDATASPDERRRLHLRLTKITSDSEAAARHLALGTDLPDESVAATLESAAHHASDRGAPDTAAALLDEARRLTPPGLRELHANRGVALAKALWDIGDVVRSRRIVEEAVATLPVGRDRSVALLLLAVHALWTDGATAAIEICTSALEGAGSDVTLRATLHLRIAYAADEDLALASRHARQARELLEGHRVGGDLLACALLSGAWVDLMAGNGYAHADVEKARRLLASPAESARPHVAFPARAIARERDWLVLAAMDDLPGAYESLRRQYDDDREIGLDRSGPIALGDLAELACWLGDLAAAQEYVEAAAELGRQTGNTPFTSAVVRLAEGLLAAHRGDLPRATDAADTAGEAAAPLKDRVLVARVSMLHGLIALSAERPGDAVSHYASAYTALDEAGIRHPLEGRFRGDEIESLVLVGELELARKRLKSLDAAAAAAPTPWAAAIGARCRALMAAADGDVGEALRRIDEAISIHGSMAMPIEHGRTLLLAGQLHRRQRSKRAAGEALGQAERLFARVGAAGWAARAQREMARLGLRPAAPDELTATEREVATLAASGMTIRQVADAMLLSPKSVDGALTRVYQKLGIHSRAELGARMGDASTAPR